MTKKLSSDMRRAVAYLRKSSPTEEKQTATLGEQREEILKYAKSNDYEIIDWYTESESGTTTDERPEYTKIIERAEQKGDFQFLIVNDQKRYSRAHPRETDYWTYRLEKAGAQVVIRGKGVLDDENIGSDVEYRVNAHLAYGESKDKGEAVARGLHARAVRGGHHGDVPYGYVSYKQRVDSVDIMRLKPGDPEKQRIVKKVFKDYARGKTLTEICDELDRLGVPVPSANRIPRRTESTKGPNTGKWYTGTIKSWLQNRVYIGIVDNGKESNSKFYKRTKDGKEQVGKGKGVRTRNPQSEWTSKKMHKGLVSVDLFKEVQDLLARTTRKRRKNPNGYKYLLSGVAKCAKCGRNLNGDKTPSGQRRMLCLGRKRGQCEGNAISEKELFQLVSEELSKRYSLDEITGKMIVDAKKGKLKLTQLPKGFKRLQKDFFGQFRPSNDKEDLKLLEKQIASLSQKIERARKNLAVVEVEFVKDIQIEIHQMEAERSSLEAERELKSVKRTDANQQALEIFWSCFRLKHLVSMKARKNSEGEEETLRQLVSIKVDTDKVIGRGRGGERYEVKTIAIEFPVVGQIHREGNSHRSV